MASWLSVISFGLISLLNDTKTKNPVAANIDEFSFTQFKEGTRQGVVFGDVRTPAWMVLYYGNLRSSPITSKGGKK